MNNCGFWLALIKLFIAQVRFVAKISVAIETIKAVRVDSLYYNTVCNSY